MKEIERKLNRNIARWWGAGLLMVILVCLSAAALAAAPQVSFHWTVEGEEISLGLVEKNKVTYLFLPGSLKGKDPVLSLDQDVQLIWGEETYQSGDIFPAEKYLGQELTASYSTGRKIGNVKVMEGSEIPSMFFTIDPDEYARINKNTKFDIRQEAAMVMLAGDGTVNASQTVPSFKTHGNSTFYAGKKAFVFKMEKKVALGGMEKNKKWMLLANWFDISLIRNQMTYDLCREIGLTSTPDCCQVDLYINGAYNGTYLLTEKIQLKKGRLEIEDLEEELEDLNGREVYDNAAWKKTSGVVKHIRWFDLPSEPEDVSGGFLLEIEKSLHYSKATDVAGFQTDKGMCVVVKEPTHAGYQAVQYIAGLVNDFHNAVVAKDGISKATGKYYSDYIDMRSFALKIIVEEFTANYDVRAASQFMYKDKDSIDSKLYAGPGWDYDLTYGNKDDGTRNPLKQNYVLKRSTDESYLYHWLLTHEDFQVITRQLYEEVFLPAAEVLAGRREPAEGSPLRSVAAYQDAIRDSAAMNFTRWIAKSIPDVWDPSGRTFEDAGAFVQSWVDQRMDMMTETWLLEE